MEEARAGSGFGIGAAPAKPSAEDGRGAIRGNTVWTAAEWEAHVARVKEARGKFAWVRTSSEEFCRRKQEEIDREDEQSQRRMQ